MNLFDLYTRLHRTFGLQGWWPRYNNATDRIEYRPGDYLPVPEEQQFEIAVGAILTQNTSWANVEKALLNLHRAGIMSKQSLLATDNETIAALIKPAGYFNLKTRKLKEFCSFRGEVTRDRLLDVWGIGEETADSILLYAYQQSTFIVDMYTKRVIERIGYAEKTYADIQQLFMKNLPADHAIYNEFHALLVALGKELCSTTPYCGSCKGCQLLSRM